MKFTIVALLQIFLVFLFTPQRDTQDDISISKTVVTNAQYVRFCNETGREKPEDALWIRDDMPVINIDWKDATAFHTWLSKK